MLRLRILGGLDLRDADGRELTAALSQPKRAALLAYLGARPAGAYCRRDTLLALFWPESDTERARTALRGALHFLRRALGPDAIRTRGDDVGVDPALVACDAADFERAIAEDRLDDALGAYAGDLLAGVHVADAPEFERWRDDERARLRRLALDAAATLGARREGAGDVAGAIRAARRGVALAPDDEALAQRLVALLDRAGDRAGALRAYDELASRLRSEYESDPSPETRALVDAIRRRAAPGARALETAAPAPASMDGPSLAASAHAAPAVDASSPADGAATTRAVATPAVATPAVATPAIAAPTIAAPANGPPVGASPASAPRRTRRVGALVLVGALLLSVVGAVAWQALGARVARADATSPDVIAVLPFAYEGARGTDYLGTGLARLLGTNLNGAGTLRTVDPVALQRALGDPGPAPHAPVDERRARDAATRLGAGLVVRGHVTESDGRLRIAADVLGADGTSEIVVDGTSERLFDLVDELTARVVAAWGARRGQRLTSIAARTTSSLPALRAYLEGEREFAGGRYAAAVDAYQRAVAADSTFALAYYRLSSALTWTSAPLPLDATARARRYVQRLTRRDSLLVEARYANASGYPEHAERLYRTVLADYPDEVEAWYQLGEVGYHWAAMLGRAAQAAETAFARTVALDPAHVPALVHLARLAASDGRLARLDSLRARIGGLGASPEEGVELDALRAFAASSGASLGTPSDADARGAAERARVAERLRAGRSPVVQLRALAASTGNVAAALAVARTLGTADPPARPDETPELLVAQLELARGRWRAANAALDAFAERFPAHAAQYRAAWAALPFVPATAAELDAAGVALARASVAREAQPVPAGISGAWEVNSGLLPGRRAYALARVAARAGDTLAALRTIEAFGRGVPARRAGRPRAPGAPPNAIPAATAAPLDTPFAERLRARLTAERLGRDGAAAAGLRLLGAPGVPLDRKLPRVASFVTADERYLRAELLRAAGRTDEALGWYASFPDPGGYDLVYLGPALRRRAELLERRGDRDAARGHYRRFVALWAECDPELRPLVDEARRRLTALGG